MIADNLIDIPRRRKMLINLTSLIDVMFILLLFLMVSTTFSSTMAIKVSLPNVKGENISEKETKIEIIVTKEEKIMLNGNPVSISKMPEQIKQLSEAQKIQNPSIHFKVDKGVQYDFAVKVMSEIKKAGILTIMAITESEEK